MENPFNSLLIEMFLESSLQRLKKRIGIGTFNSLLIEMFLERKKGSDRLRRNISLRRLSILF